MVAKISISIPEELLQKIEAERQAKGESRSEFFSHLVERYFYQKRMQELEEQYIRGYELYPETEEEIAFARATALRVFKDNPWDEEETS